MRPQPADDVRPYLRTVTSWGVHTTHRGRESGMTGITARALYQQRRPAPERSNNSLRRTYDLLRSSLHHSLAPGASLVEEELVQTLSSSRNTVRAALQLLAQEGLVSRGPKVGTMALGSIILPFNDLLDVGDKVAYRMTT